MFLVFILIAGGAAIYAALGMYAVWFKVLAILFRVSAIIILALAGGVLWRRLFHK